MKLGRGLRRILWGLIVAGLLLGLFPGAASAGSLSFAWDPNQEADLAGYKLYLGTSSRTYSQAIDVGRVTTFTVSDLTEGEIYFSSVTAYNIFTNESNFSNEVSTTIPVTAQPPEPDNSPPWASFAFTCSDLACSFTTNTSTDADGFVVAWNWDFGHGASSTEQSPNHTYPSDGTYTVTLVVTDDGGATGTTSQAVTVSSSQATAPAPEPACARGKSCDRGGKGKPKKK